MVINLKILKKKAKHLLAITATSTYIVVNRVLLTFKLLITQNKQFQDLAFGSGDNISLLMDK